MDALQGEAHHALENGLTSDQAALSEAIQTLVEVKEKMWQEEERIRGKTREALRFKAEWKSRQFSNSFGNDGIQSSQGQALCLVMILAKPVAIIGGVLLVLK